MLESGLLWELCGGLMIGAAAALFFWLNGRIAGISGMFGDLLFARRQDHGLWRWTFLLGLLLGYLAIRTWRPELGEVNLQTGPVGMIVAGLLVGYGTRLGSGCTSGHGICGMASLSVGSMWMVAVFLSTAIVTALLMNALGVV